MDTKKISSAELSRLFQFMQQKRVRYYDLQVELVDHFASAIEVMWKEDPAIPFEHAIAKIYDQFPVTGFHSVITAQTKAIQKDAWRWVLYNWKRYFQWPRILLSLVVLLLLRLVFQLPVATELLTGSLSMLLLLIAVVRYYQLVFAAKKRNRRFLRLDATYNTISFVMTLLLNPLLQIGFQLIAGSNLPAIPDWAEWPLAAFFTYFAFFLYIVFYQLPLRAEGDLLRHFPKLV